MWGHFWKLGILLTTSKVSLMITEKGVWVCAFVCVYVCLFWFFFLPVVYSTLSPQCSFQCCLPLTVIKAMLHSNKKRTLWNYPCQHRDTLFTASIPNFHHQCHFCQMLTSFVPWPSFLETSMSRVSDSLSSKQLESRNINRKESSTTAVTSYRVNQ